MWIPSEEFLAFCRKGVGFACNRLKLDNHSIAKEGNSSEDFFKIFLIISDDNDLSDRPSTGILMDPSIAFGRPSLPLVKT
jgi:hypothetical protein